MPRTLYAKLALALAVLLGLAGALFVVGHLLTTRAFLQEVHQKLHRDLAANLVKEALLLDEGRLNEEALENIFHDLMVINPSIECYLLDPEGEILAFSAPPDKVLRERVSLDPVRRFMAEPGTLPLLGDDPRGTERRKPFSVAPIQSPAGFEGYLYVVLGGEQWDSALEMLRNSYILKLGTWSLLAGLILVLAAGLYLFNHLTRRLRRLTATMDTFRSVGFEGSPEKRVEPKPAGDEIDRMGATYAAMAERITEQIERLDRADRLRRELVANVSHDLRTPLTTLQGYLETLLIKEDDLSPEEKRRYLEIASRHGERLATLVSELFELARLDASEIRPQVESFSLGELVQDVTREFQLAAEHQGVRLEPHLVEGLPFVEGDVGLVARVLENLVGNAVRHTPDGGRVTVSVAGVGDSVLVRIRDTGCGIAPDELPHVFDRFYQVGSHPEGAVGAGLGLAIARKILELHEREIQVESAPGVGSTFSFSLPTSVEATN